MGTCRWSVTLPKSVFGIWTWGVKVFQGAVFGNIISILLEISAEHISQTNISKITFYCFLLWVLDICICEYWSVGIWQIFLCISNTCDTYFWLVPGKSTISILPVFYELAQHYFWWYVMWWWMLAHMPGCVALTENRCSWFEVFLWWISQGLTFTPGAISTLFCKWLCSPGLRML